MSAHLGFRHQVCHSRIQVLGFGVDGCRYRAINIYIYCDQRGSIKLLGAKYNRKGGPTTAQAKN